MGKKLYLGIFLISLATLVLEVALTRILSVVLWHHFAFMVVSIALFGFGASGTFLSVSRVLRRPLEETFPRFALLFSVSALVGYLVVNHVQFDPFRLAEPSQLLIIGLYYLALGVPFFASGVVVGMAISKSQKDVGNIYFANLIGSGLGALLTVGLFGSGAFVVLVASALGALASAVFSRRGALWLAVLLVLVAISPGFLEVQSSPYKDLNLALKFQGTRLVSTDWNPLSKVDVLEGPFRYAPGLSYKYKEPLESQMAIAVDGDNLNAIAVGGGYLDFMPVALPYFMGSRGKALVVYPGGGTDVALALAHADEVEIIEPNPLLVEKVKEHGIYDKVRVHQVDARAFQEEGYDLIQISLGGSPATGLHALSENYLFTVEAFKGFLGQLNKDGVLVASQWLLPPPRAEARLASLLGASLDGPEEKIVAIRSLNTITFLAKNVPFTQEEIEKVRAFANERQFDLVYVPGIEAGEVNRFNRFPEPMYHEAVMAALAGNTEGYLFNIEAPTDDLPFFFHFFRWSRLPELYQDMGQKWQPFVEGGYLTPVILLQALVLAFLFIYLPLGLKKVRPDWEIAYFALLGIAFMFVEICLIQRFILFLGQPLYSISVVIACLLTFSGLGSYFSRREGLSILKRAIPLLAGILLVYVFALDWAFTLGLNRYLLSVALLAPVGFLMGMPFPVGIRAIRKGQIPWAWCINGCFSVMSSVLAVVVALSFGFKVVLLLAIVAYVMALVLSLKL